MRALSQILTAGIAITAFALLLYSFAFNLRNRVARPFAFILVCLVVIFSAEAIASTASRAWELSFGRVFSGWALVSCPPFIYISRTRCCRLPDAPAVGAGAGRFASFIWISRFFCSVFPFNRLAGPVMLDSGPAPHLQPTF